MHMAEGNDKVESLLVCHAKIGPTQKWSARTISGSQNWSSRTISGLVLGFNV